ncbi:MAG: O-antigen ligase family protein, partial [Patescibacteria group bacterium]
GGLFLCLAFLILFQSIFSPTILIAILVLCSIVFITIIRPLWILAFLAVYFPFESVILKFIPNDAYVITRYASEGMIYVIAGVMLLRVLVRAIKLPTTPIDLAFILFLITLLGSALINFVPFDIAILGTRQILRFMIVFFLVIYLKPSKEFVKKLTMILFAIVLFQCALGFLQYTVGERLDLLLLPSDARSLGEITLMSGVEQSWEPGSRLFGTLGRYDRLGNFLSFFLLIGAGFLFGFKKKKGFDFEIKKMHLWLFGLFVFGVPALVLTYSRASWFAFLLGFLFIGLYIKRNRYVAIFLATFVLVIVSYLAMTGISVRYITETPGQTVVERFLESFSFTRWRGEYYGLGRLYWDVQTPLRVIPSAPIFGVGPGQFGGGAVAAIHNKKVYESLGLP